MEENINIIAFASIGALVVILLVAYYFLFVKQPETPAWKGKLTKKYQEILNKDLPKEYLVLELDKLTHAILKEKFSSTSSFGEIMKSKGKKLERRIENDLWGAHKLRNQLAHDMDHKPSPSELNKAIITLKNFIKTSLKE